MKPTFEIPEDCISRIIVKAHDTYQISTEVPQPGDPMIDLKTLEAGKCQAIDMEEGYVDFNWIEWDGIHTSGCTLQNARKLIKASPMIDVNQIKASLNE